MAVTPPLRPDHQRIDPSTRYGYIPGRCNAYRHLAGHRPRTDGLCKSWPRKGHKRCGRHGGGWTTGMGKNRWTTGNHIVKANKKVGFTKASRKLLTENKKDLFFVPKKSKPRKIAKHNQRVWPGCKPYSSLFKK